MRAIAKLGEKVWVQWDELRHAAAVIGTVLYLCVQPRYWARTVRNLFARQVLAVGVEPVGFVCAVAVFVGISVVVQLAFWTGKAGQSQLLGPLLVAVVVSVRPDIVLTDIQLKSSSGLDFIKAIRAHAPGLPVVATTMFDVQRTERLARAAGASAFVAKQDGPGKLIEVVRESLKDQKPQHEDGESEDA